MNMKGDDNLVPMSLFTVSEVIFSLSCHCLPSMSLHNHEDFYLQDILVIFFFMLFILKKIYIFFSFLVVQEFTKKVPFRNTILGCFQTGVCSLHHETKAEEVPSVEEAGLSPLPAVMWCGGVRAAVNTAWQPCCPCSNLQTSRG